VEIHNEFGSMSDFGSKDPGSFFVSALILSNGQDTIACSTTSVVNLGVEDFGIFEFWFIVNNDWRRWELNSIWNQIRVAGFNIEMWILGVGAKAVRKSEVTGWVPGSARISYGPRNLSDSFFEGHVVRKN